MISVLCSNNVIQLVPLNPSVSSWQTANTVTGLEIRAFPRCVLLSREQWLFEARPLSIQSVLSFNKILLCSRREQLQQHGRRLDEPRAERADAGDDALAPPHLHCTEGSKEDEAGGQLRGGIRHANRAASPSACPSPAAATPSPPGYHWLQVQSLSLYLYFN